VAAVPHAALTLARRQVDFEFFDLKPVDFHGLRALFQRYLDGELPFALSELVETLIEQARRTLLRAIRRGADLRCARGRETRLAQWSRPTATWTRWA
jgi:hypothetical protein